MRPSMMPVSQHLQQTGPMMQMGPGGPPIPPGGPPPPPPGMPPHQRMAMGNSLRLSIPPPQAMMPQPGTPTSAGQPSPSLTPRSDGGGADDYNMDSNSSRGTTPGPGDPFDNSGASTPDGFFANGEPPQKMVKRRPSQQKRRQSQSKEGPQVKKRARKGSKIDDNDYDACMEQIAHQLKNLQPIQTVEPKLGHYHNVCPVFGSGDAPKFSDREGGDLTLGKLERDSDGRLRVPEEGDYYNVMPFGRDPPVPSIQRVNFTTRGFYKQEFDGRMMAERGKRLAGEMSPPNSPDLLYSSSPEPDFDTKISAKAKLWKCLAPADSDDEDMPPTPANSAGSTPGPISGENTKENQEKTSSSSSSDPPLIDDQPKSPSMELLQPMAIRPRPRQMISMRDTREMGTVKLEDKTMTAALPVKVDHATPSGSNAPNSSSTKDPLKSINGLTKIFKIKSQTGEWVAEDKEGTDKKDIKEKGVVKEETKQADKRQEEVMDVLTVLLTERRLCRHCEKVLCGSMVGKRTKDLSFLSTQERESCREAFFCDAKCYFDFAMRRTNNEESKEATSLEQLESLQDEKQESEKKIKKESGNDGGEESSGSKEKENAAPVHKGNSYLTWTPEFAQQRKGKTMNENELTQMMFRMGTTMMPRREVEDQRECLFCHLKGDAAADGPARLLNYDVNKWVHLNCALWSEEVYETVSGALVNVETALKNGSKLYCKICEKNGATVKCWKVRCTNYYHVGCATKDRAMFYKNKSVYCNQHVPKGEKDQELTTLAVYRRVYIDRDENRQVAKVMTQGTDQHILRVGSLSFLSVGQLLPHQLHNFHTQEYIFPIGYKVIRHYWSMTEVNKRCPYVCSIGEVDNKPEFKITANEGKPDETTFTDTTAKGVWMQVLCTIERLRRKHDLVRVFPQHIRGEDLFGLSEPNIVKVLESLPGIESLSDYNFKYGRNPLLELPLAVNPTGCARSEPKMRTRVKRVHNFQRTTATGGGGGGGNGGNGNKLSRVAKENVPALIGLETTGPYSKNFVQSKSSQYRKMRQEWRQNVVLARSKIQGLGLYAARDLEKHQMIIEYIGEVIRSDLTDVREKRYESQNRGIYMFRLDDERVLDATMSGGMARYINHSCAPNCVTECVEVDRDLHIIIFASRRIQRGEELCYDYKFDFEDENRIPCLCGAENCRKWMN